MIPFNQGSRRMKLNTDEGNDVRPERDINCISKCVCLCLCLCVRERRRGS